MTCTTSANRNVGPGRPTRAFPIFLGVSLAGLVIGVTAGCGGGADRDPAADIPVTAELEDLYSIGAIDGEAWETFSEGIQVAFDAQGRLYVFDAQATSIAVVGSDGALLHQFGRKGEGPGELNFPRALMVSRGAESRVAVADISKQGFVTFESDGTYIADVPIDRGLRSALTNPAWHPDGAVTGGQRVGARAAAGGGFIAAVAAGGGDSAPRPDNPVRVLSTTDGSARLLHDAWEPERPEPIERTMTLASGNVVRLRSPPPLAFEPQVYVASLPDGRVAVVDSTTYKIFVYPAGARGAEEAPGAKSPDTPDTIARPIPPTPVTPEIEAAERARREAEIHARVEAGELDDPTSELESLESLVFRSEIPVIQGLVTDWEGRLWVTRAPAELGGEGPIDILSSEGEYLGTLDGSSFEIPQAFGPDGLVAYIELDELDVPTVVVRRLDMSIE